MPCITGSYETCIVGAMLEAMLDAGEPLKDLPEVTQDELRDDLCDDLCDAKGDDRGNELRDDRYDALGVVWKMVQNDDRLDDKFSFATTYRGLLHTLKIPPVPKAPAGTPLTVEECDTSGISSGISAVEDSSNNASQYTNGK